jgi:hypothetical protein
MIYSIEEVKRLKTQGRVEKAAHKLHYRTVFQGLPISIENRKGSLRQWFDPLQNRQGVTKFRYPYGYIRMTEGEDGDHIDCFVGPDDQSPHVFIVRQQNPHTAVYDEDKVMLGFSDMESARKAYLAHYDSPNFLGDMDYMPIEGFKEAIKEKNGYLKVKQDMQKVLKSPALIIKAKDYGRLTPVRQWINRGGKWYQSTVYVDPARYANTEVRIEGNEIFTESKDREVVRRTVYDYAKRNLQGKTVRNHDSGFLIRISAKGLHETLQKRGLSHFRSIYAIPEMIKKAKYVGGPYRDRKGRPDLSYHRFRCSLSIDRERYLVNMVVYEVRGDEDVKRYYDHSLSTIKKLD